MGEKSPLNSITMVLVNTILILGSIYIVYLYWTGGDDDPNLQS